MKYMIIDNATGNVIRAGFRDWQAAWVFMGYLLRKIDHCVDWSIREMLP